MFGKGNLKEVQYFGKRILRKLSKIAEKVWKLRQEGLEGTFEDKLRGKSAKIEKNLGNRTCRDAC